MGGDSADDTERASSFAPALTPEQWAEVNDKFARGKGAFMFRLDLFGFDVASRPDISLALANHLMPDHDPRKITWAKVKAMRTADLANFDEDFGYDERAHRELKDAQRILAAFADQLAALLPPE